MQMGVELGKVKIMLYTDAFLDYIDKVFTVFDKVNPFLCVLIFATAIFDIVCIALATKRR